MTKQKLGEIAKSAQKRTGTNRARRIKLGQTVQMLNSYGFNIRVQFVVDTVTFYDERGKVQLSDHKNLSDAEVWLAGFCVGCGYKVEAHADDPQPKHKHD